MANKMQIKRSTTTAAPAGLANGELAYTSNGEILFLGHPDGTTGSIAIGGRRVPGTLTANQALVANSTSGIDKVLAANVAAITNLYVGANVIANTSAYFVGNSSVNSTLTSSQLSIGANVFANSSAFDVGNTIITSALLTLGGQVNANGGVGTAGQILTSGAAGNVYWSSPAAGVAGSNSQVQFNANGVLAGDSGFTFDGVSNTLTVANAIITANITHPVGTTELYIYGTTNNSVGAVEAGGDISLKAGSANGGGLVTIQGGTVADSGAVTRTGGSVAISGGDAQYGDTGGDLYLDGGGGGALSASPIGGSIYLTGGGAQSNSNGVGGTIEIYGGNGNTTGGTGGSVTIAGGFGAGSSRANVQITKLKTLDVMTVGGNIVLGTTTISANGGVGTAGQVLTSGAAGNVYWSTPAAGVAGSNSQVQFNANGVLSGDAGFVFDGVADALILGGTGQTTSPTFRVANSTTSANLSSATLTIGTAVVNSSAVAAGTNAYMNVTSVFISTNSTINATHTAALFQVANSTGTANLTAVALTIGTTIANSTGLFIGANVFANASAFDVGNTTITTTNLTLGGQITANGGVGSAGQVLTSGAAGNAYWTTPTTGTVTSVTGGNGLTGSVSTSGALDVGEGAGLSVTTDAVAVKANNGIIANTTGVFVDGANGVSVDASGVNVLRGDGTLTVNATGVYVNTANLSVATSQLSGDVALGTQTSGNYVATITAGNGISGAATGEGSTPTIAVVANSGIVSNSTGVFVLANTGIIANSTGVFVNPVLSLTDLTLSGNLDVNGTLTTIDATNLSVTDSLISLARGQTTANTLDIGVYGTYGNATVTSYTGLFRDATDSKYKLFAGAIPEPTTTVDTANVNYAGATLVVQALEGANSTATIDSFIIDGGTF